MLIKRPFWQQLIEEAWKQKTVIWLMGVRGIGKKSLCQSLENVEYFDCESLRTRQLIEKDPEGFLESNEGKRIVLDEIHRLDNPSEILKVAADHYPKVKIIATGSSTLGASAKFRDTLTGRKRVIWLTPLLLQEMGIFGSADYRRRFLFGGFPFAFTQERFTAGDFREWLDAYWARDIQELFKVGKRASFQKFAELLFANSGGLFEASKYATDCEVSRQTIGNYRAVLEETFVVQVIRPYSTRKATEIVKAPKVYGFDTGFTCYAKGWHELRQEDLGFLWEQCILNEIQGQLQTRSINYWRDKQGHEIDFVIPERGNRSVTVIECKFTNSSEATIAAVGKNVEAFRSHYPNGENFVVSSNIDKPFKRRHEDITLSFVSAQDLIKELKELRI